MPILFGAMWGPHDDCDTHTLILTITIKDTFFPENEMIVNIKMCVGMMMMMIAFITFKSSLVPLFEGL